MPWLLNEDAALKAKLQGIQVFDGNAPNGRTVPVRYRLPEVEPADLTFPIIVISHNGWYYAPERAHDGFAALPYAPEGEPTWWDDSLPLSGVGFDPNDSPYRMWFPIPYNFDYRVSVYSRFMHEHTIPIISTLAGYNYLNAKYGYLNIPQDGTKRTLQLLGGPDLFTEQDSNGKRVFRVEYIVRVFSELVPQAVQAVAAQFINFDFSVYTDSADLTGTALAKSKGLLSVGSATAWNVAQSQI